MNKKFKNNPSTFQAITAKIAGLEPKYQAKVIVQVLTPKVIEELKKQQEAEKCFKTIKELWRLNANVDEKEAGNDIEEALTAIRQK